MKTKQKLVLSLAALSAITLGVGATSTFAWFTTTRTANANLVSALVKAQQGDLEIKYAGDGTNGGTSSTNDTYTNTAISITGVDKKNFVTDISGNGLVFNKPHWSPSKLTTAEDDITEAYASYWTATGFDLSANSANDHYYMEFKLSFHNKGNKKINIYLDKDTDIVPHLSTDGEDIKAAKASRCAILNSDATSLLSIFSGTGSTGTQYVVAETGAKLYGASDYTLGDSKWIKNNGSLGTADEATDVWVGPASNLARIAGNVTATATTYHGLLLGTAEANDDDGTPSTDDNLDITVRMWVEGTDPDAVNTSTSDTAIDGLADLKLAFAAVDFAA